MNTNAAVATIQFALDADDGMSFLRLWNQGDFEVCRREWPEAPDECYIGADPLHPKTPKFHTDDLAVDEFADAMKLKLADAREKGRAGWEQCAPEVLSEMLREHVDKGDPRDVGNLCAFLWSLGHPIKKKEVTR
ncbi:TPA: hypothetical protein ACYLN4_004015 [Burkholderia lata]